MEKEKTSVYMLIDRLHGGKFIETIHWLCHYFCIIIYDIVLHVLKV